MLFIIFCDIAIVCAVFSLLFMLKSEVQSMSKKSFKRELARSSAAMSKICVCSFAFFSLMTLLSYVFNL